MSKKYSRSYKVSQEGIETHVKRALDSSGKPTFIVAESVSGYHLPRRKRKSWPSYKIALVCNNVLKDIGRLIEADFHGPCDTDDGELLFEQALPFLVARHVAYERPEEKLNTSEWAWRWTRKVAADHPREWFLEAEQRILKTFDNFNGAPSIPSPDSVSKALRLTAERRERGGLRHLPAIERPPSVRKREAKEQDRRRKAAERARDGATPRSASREARKPWEAAGVSRATWFRARADGRVIELEFPAKAEGRPDTSAPVLRLVSSA